MKTFRKMLLRRISSGSFCSFLYILEIISGLFGRLTHTSYTYISVNSVFVSDKIINNIESFGKSCLF